MRSRYSMLTVSIILLFGPLLTDGAELLRDPTRPYSVMPVVIPAIAASFTVTAIFMSDKRRVAIVNGKRVSEGDLVDGATVVEILADALRLNFEGKAITTRVLPNGFRQ